MRWYKLNVRESYAMDIKLLWKQRHNYKAVTSYRKRIHNEIRAAVRKLRRFHP